MIELTAETSFKFSTHGLNIRTLLIPQEIQGFYTKGHAQEITQAIEIADNLKK